MKVKVGLRVRKEFLRELERGWEEKKKLMSMKMLVTDGWTGKLACV